MRVIVVGGAGYIGSHTCKALAEAGHEPIVFDNLVYGHADAVRWGPLEVGDIADGDRLDEVFARHRPDAVLHFAAFAYVAESMHSPEKYYNNNVVGSLSLLDAMRRAAVANVVFSSSCATYGVPARLPIDEATPQVPINPYGFTKLVVERALADYGRAHRLNWVALRYFNAAGCDPDGELGERHDPETHAIPCAIAAAFGHGPRFRVFGTDYPTPDGSAQRDYVHVSDLADAHVRAVEHLVGGGASGAFNLATGTPTSVLEIVAAVERATGRPLPVDFDERRPGDPPVLYASASKAREVLGWRPRHETIAGIVDTAVRWYMENRCPVV